MKTVQSQCDMILYWMKDGRPITPLEALENLGCFRLASRICDLRKRGAKITKRMVHAHDSCFAEYRLEQ